MWWRLLDWISSFRDDEGRAKYAVWKARTQMAYLSEHGKYLPRYIRRKYNTYSERFVYLWNTNTDRDCYNELVSDFGWYDLACSPNERHVIAFMEAWASGKIARDIEKVRQEGHYDWKPLTDLYTRQAATAEAQHGTREQ